MAYAFKTNIYQKYMKSIKVQILPYLPSCNFVKRLEGRRGIPRRSHCEAKAFPVRCRSSCNLETVGGKQNPLKIEGLEDVIFLEENLGFIHRSFPKNTWQFYLPPDFSTVKIPPKRSLKCHWLVVEPTHLEKYAQVKLDHETPRKTGWQ